MKKQDESKVKLLDGLLQVGPYKFHPVDDSTPTENIIVVAYPAVTSVTGSDLVWFACRDNLKTDNREGRLYYYQDDSLELGTVSELVSPYLGEENQLDLSASFSK